MEKLQKSAEQNNKKSKWEDTKKLSELTDK